MKLAINQILTAAIAVVSITIAAVLFISIRQSQKVRDTSQSVRHTEQVIQHIQKVILAALDNETGARGFIITGKAEFLTPLLSAEKNLRAELISLRQLLADNPRQIYLLDSLRIYADKRFAFSDSMVRTREQEGQKAAIAMVESGTGKWYTDNIRRICDEMASIGQGLLETREKQNNKVIGQLDINLYCVLAALFLVSLFLIRRIKADIRRQKASEQKFISLLDAAPDATIIVNEGGVIKLINQQTVNLLGYTRNELIGQPVEILMPQVLKSEHIRHREGFMKSAKVRSMGAGMELRAVRKDGTNFPVEISLSPIRTNDGVLVSASVRDISERKKAEDKLKKAKEDFQLLVTSVKDYAIFMLDQNGRVKSWNSGAEYIKGYTEEEIIGKPLDIFYTAEEKQRGEPQRNLQNALQHGHYETEGLRVRKDGSTFYANIVFTSLVDEAGKHFGYAKITRDITEKRKTEERIQFLASIAGNIQDPVIASDNNFCTTSWNEAAEKLFEWKSEEVIGKPTREVLKIIYPDHGREEIFQSFTENGYWQGEVIYHTKSGKPLNVLATASQLKDANETVTGILVLAKDITERKKTEKQLEEFEHFFNNSHDLCGIANTVGYFDVINTNFSKVLGYTEKEFCETPFIELIHPDDIAGTLHEYDKLKSGELTINFINRYRKKDGNYLYLDWNATPNPLTGKLYCVARDITDRKKAEEALNKLNAELEQRVRERTAEIEKKEKRFRALIENNYDIISLMDERFNVFYRSPSAARITGWTDEEILNIDGREKIHPDDREKAGIIVQELMAHPGKTIHTLFRNQHKDGHYLWVEGTVINLLQDEDVKAIVFNFRDITQRKELEDLLHKANLLARIGGWEIDLVMGKVYWSDITKEIHETGDSYVPDLETGVNFYKEGKGRNLIIEKVNEAIEFGKPWDLELQIITAKNNERWIRTIGETEFINGKCVRIYGSFQDIDQRKKAEEKLVKERALLRTLIDNLPDYIYVKDTRSRHLINNKANVDLLSGSTEKETIGKTVNDFLAYEVAVSNLEDDQLVFQSGKPIINKEETILSPTGETKYLLTTKVPLRDEDNSVIGLVGISRDITWQKQIELDLREKKYFLEKAQQVGQIGYWISEIGSTGKLIWSAETCRIFGTEPAEFDGQLKTFFSFIHPEDIDRLNSATSYAVENNLTYRIEHRIILHDGATRWVYEQGEATYDESGKALLIIGIVQDITERKEEEEKLIRNEELMRLAEANYREIFDKANDGIYVHELETGKVVNVNQRATELNGFSKEELLTGDPRDFMTDHPDYTFEKAIGHLQKAAAGEPQFFEWLGRCKDGSSSWFEMNLKKTSIGGKDRILAFQRDINDRKRVEEALRRSEARARRIFESDMIGFILWSEKGQILEANDYFLRMTGYSREDLEKGLVSWAAMTPPEYEDLDIIALEQIAHTGICKPFEKEYIRKDGSRFPIILGAAALGPSFDGVGVCYVMDISERIKAAETIVETLKEKNSILESIGDAFFAVDKDWTVTYWNRIAEIALGVSKQDIVGKNLWEIFSDSVESLSYEKYHQALATNQVVHFADFYAALHKWYEISAYPSENGLSVYFKDVTERQKAAEEIKKLNAELEEKVINRTEQLRKANEELEAFTYSVSHDLRAPLRGIIGFTTILEEDYSSKLDEEARRITGVIKINTLKMGNLIDDLLTFSRMGRQDIEKSMINTNEMVQEIINNLENKNTAGSIEWVISSLHDTYGDSNTIRQVWINLISNAIKYSGGKPKQRIEIGSALLKGQATFFVKDNGVGFDIKYSNKLFKVFQRLHGSNEFEGTGVGLAIVEKIVSKHDGKVWATGKVDNGAVFYFSLPVKQPDVQLIIT
ncbi:MAG: PAS domain S-box protein [Chitinophagaceae bacterium]